MYLDIRVSKFLNQHIIILGVSLKMKNILEYSCFEKACLTKEKLGIVGNGGLLLWFD